MTDRVPGSAPCPFCGSRETGTISFFGTGEMTMQCECHACGSTFERVKWDAGRRPRD